MILQETVSTPSGHSTVSTDFPALSNQFADSDSEFIVVTRFEGVDSIHNVNPGFPIGDAKQQAFELCQRSYGMNDEQALEAIKVSAYRWLQGYH